MSKYKNHIILIIVLFLCLISVLITNILTYIKVDEKNNKNEIIIENNNDNTPTISNETKYYNTIIKTFKILSKTTENNTTIYTVTAEGYVDYITLKITINDVDKKITAIDVISVNESFYSKVENADYINKLMDSQENISDCSTVSGATYTSTTLKLMVSKVLSDYRGEE